MDEDSPRNVNPFLLKEDLFSTYLNQKNTNIVSDPWKYSQEDFFFRPETNFLNKFFDNDRLSNISQGEQMGLKFDFNNEAHENINQEEASLKKKLESTQASFSVGITKEQTSAHADKDVKPTNIVINDDNNNNNNGGEEYKDASNKELKLLKNRLSARKCRLKKKSYIKQLEEEVEEYRSQVDKYKSCSKKEKSFENDIHLIDEQEQKLGQLTQKNQIEATKIEYVANQRRLLDELFVREVKLMMPIECKLFQNKFLKLAQFDYGDSHTVILNKINTNIQMLNELYEFKKKSSQGSKGNNKLPAYKLYTFYENLKHFAEVFASNCKMIA